MWQDQWLAFSQRFRALRYDLRGFGRSAPVAGSFSHSADLLAMLDFLGIGRATMLGCSKGGSIVLDFGLEHPDRVAGLVLVTSSPGGFAFEGDAPSQWDEMVAAFKDGDFDRAAELEVQIWVDGPQRRPEQVEASVRARVQAMDRIALANETLGLGSEVPLEPPRLAAWARSTSRP
jgi:pimeloyl-ACP methyl ester carboxylesterase